MMHTRVVGCVRNQIYGLIYSMNLVKEKISSSTLGLSILVIAMTGFCLPASAQQDWTNLDSMSEPRYEASVSQYNEDIYVFNGLGAGNIVRSTIEKFDADTLSWTVVGTTSAGNSTAVTHNGLIRDGNTVWLIGGRIGNTGCGI